MDNFIVALAEISRQQVLMQWRGDRGKGGRGTWLVALFASCWLGQGSNYLVYFSRGSALHCCVEGKFDDVDGILKTDAIRPSQLLLSVL